MSFFAEERKAAARAVAEQNKRRSRQMEQRIAKALQGNRIPMSGAGSIKGDCRVITDQFGEVMIECKYSSETRGAGHKNIYLRMDWLDKLDKDVKSMRSAFGALVFHYHGDRLSDYVMVRSSVFEKIRGAVDIPVHVDLKHKLGYGLEQRKLDPILKEYGYFHLVSRDQHVYIMTLAEFKELIHVRTNTLQ